MKTAKLFIYSLVLLLAGALVSCVNENLYEEGAPDLENCYGVYFPSQENIKSHEFEPSSESYELVFKVKRLKDEGEITVPYTIEPADMFTGSSIIFREGQTETTFKVKLSDKAEIGTSYNCNVSIDDPEYALSYSEYKSGMDFSAIVVKWNRLKGPDGEEFGRWRDDFFTALLAFPAMENDKIIIEERDDKPGYFRIKDAYTADFWAPVFGVEDVDALRSYFTNPTLILDASNPDKVFFPYQYICDLSFVQGGGEVGFVQYTNDNLVIEPSESLYGTYDKENGIIEYPKDAFYITMNRQVFNIGNQNELFRIVLPGFNPVDYSMAYKPSPSAGGEVAIACTFGASVSRVKYAIFPGKLSDVAAREKASEINGGELEDATVAEVAAGENVVITVSGLDKTGVYTLVSANYSDGADDPNEYVDYSYQDFTYVKAGDETAEGVAVVLGGELLATDKYESLGFTSENALEIYLKGTGITEVYIRVEEGDLTSYPSDLLAQFLFDPYIQKQLLEPVDAEMLAAINGEGYIDAAVGLMPGTQYTMLVYAYNGYQWDVVKIPGRTAGVYNIAYDTFYYDPDLEYSDLRPAELSDLCGTYDYWAVDILDEKSNGMRKKVGTVTIAEDGGEAVITGLMGAGAKAAGLESDPVRFAFKNGMIGSLPYAYMTGPNEPAVYVQDGKLGLPLAVGYVAQNPAGQALIAYAMNSYTENLLLAGKVTGDDGSEAIAFADSYIVESMGYAVMGLGLCGYDSQNYGSALKIFSAYSSPILVPQNAGSAKVSPAAARPASLESPRNVFRPAGVKSVEYNPEPVAFKAEVSVGQESARTSEVRKISAQELSGVKLRK